MLSTVYMVNPAGDLSSTQATFEEAFKRQQTWQVILFLACCVLLHCDAVGHAFL